MLQHVGELGRWMEANHPEPAVSALRGRMSSRGSAVSAGRSWVDRSLESLVDHLRDLGVVGPELAFVVDPLIEAYRG